MGFLREALVSVRDLAQHVSDGRAKGVEGAHPPTSLLTVRADGLGDLILWIPAAAMIRAALGPVRQALVVPDRWAELCRAVGLWDDVVGIDPRGVRTHPSVRASTLSRLADIQCDAVLNPMGHLYFSDAEAIVRHIPARRRLGVDLPGSGWRGVVRRRSYDRLFEPPSSEWHFDRNVALAREVASLLNPSAPVPEPPAEHPLAEMVAGHTLAKPGESGPGKKRYLVIFPRTGLDRRNPDETVVEAIIRRTLHETDLNVVLLDPTPLSELKARFNDEPRVVQHPAATLIDVVLQVAGAHVVVGGDSGGAHLAAALGRPTVVVLGGGHFDRFFPYGDSWPSEPPRVVAHAMECFGCDWQCTLAPRASSPFPCIQHITADAVWDQMAPLVA